MAEAIAKSMKFPHFFVSIAIWWLKKKVLKAANFDLESVSPISVDRSGREVPAVFGHAEKDQFIPFDHCQRLYEHYQSDRKFLMTLPGGHNSVRPREWIQLGIEFCFTQFGMDVQNLEVVMGARLHRSDFHFSSFEEMVKEDSQEVDEELNPSELEAAGLSPDEVDLLMSREV
jgi:hypothetical protein